MGLDLHEISPEMGAPGLNHLPPEERYIPSGVSAAPPLGFLKVVYVVVTCVENVGEMRNKVVAEYVERNIFLASFLLSPLRSVGFVGWCDKGNVYIRFVGFCCIASR